LPSQAPGPYQELFGRYQARQAQDEAKAHSARPRPAMRYSAGMWDQRIVAPLKRCLPYRWFERILSAAMGV